MAMVQVANWMTVRPNGASEEVADFLFSFELPSDPSEHPKEQGMSLILRRAKASQLSDQ